MALMQNEREWRAFNRILVANEVVIGGPLFPHKDCHKVTWVCPDQRTQNLINYAVINQRWMSSRQDVRVKRRADRD